MIAAGVSPEQNPAYEALPYFLTDKDFPFIFKRIGDSDGVGAHDRLRNVLRTKPVPLIDLKIGSNLPLKFLD